VGTSLVIGRSSYRNLIASSRNSEFRHCKFDIMQVPSSAHCICLAARFRLITHHHKTCASCQARWRLQWPRIKNAHAKLFYSHHQTLKPGCSLLFGNALSLYSLKCSPMSEMNLQPSWYMPLFPCPQTLAVRFGWGYLIVPATLQGVCHIHVRVLFSGVRVPFLASESGSLQIYTNQSSSQASFTLQPRKRTLIHVSVFSFGNKLREGPMLVGVFLEVASQRTLSPKKKTLIHVSLPLHVSTAIFLDF
jgi:hypothetical protein